MNVRGRYKDPGTTKMNLFTTIVNRQRPLTIAVRISITDMDIIELFILSFGKQWLVPFTKMKYGFFLYLFARMLSSFLKQRRKQFTSGAATKVF